MDTDAGRAPSTEGNKVAAARRSARSVQTQTSRFITDLFAANDGVLKQSAQGDTNVTGCREFRVQRAIFKSLRNVVADKVGGTISEVFLGLPPHVGGYDWEESGKLHRHALADVAME